MSISTAEDAWLRREEAAEEAYDKAHRTLMEAMVDALDKNPNTVMATPAWRTDSGLDTKYTAADLVLDEVSGLDGTRLNELLQLVAVAARSTDVSVRLRAQAWQAAVARRYADEHAAEVAE